MNLPSVSIIMSVTNRPINLNNSMVAWSKIDYPNFDFTIIDNGSENRKIEDIVKSYNIIFPINYYKEKSRRNMNLIWNEYGKASKGEYVVFSMMDEIISHKDILQKMVCFEDSRVSIFTYFMDREESARMNMLDWHKDPTIIPRPHTDQTTAGLISHITGNYRDNWDFFGWFRGNPSGHLWLDQDVHLREGCLCRNLSTDKYYCRTAKDVYCLHQYHGVDSGLMREPGYIYKTERQARLIDEAERENS